MITTVDGLRYGQLVKSIAGRDQESYYLIVDLVGERYIRVVDGLHHPLRRPKKKNVKHVQITMAVATEIETAITEETTITDAQIHTAIHRLKNQLEEGDRIHGETRCDRS